MWPLIPAQEFVEAKVKGHASFGFLKCCFGSGYVRELQKIDGQLVVLRELHRNGKVYLVYSSRVDALGRHVSTMFDHTGPGATAAAASETGVVGVQPAPEEGERGGTEPGTKPQQS